MTTTQQLQTLSDQSLSIRMSILEALILREADWKKLPALNAAFRRLLDERVRRDVER